MTKSPEGMADIPQNFKARAVNAVLPTLKAHGEWLRLSTRQAVANAVLAAVLPTSTAPLAAGLPHVDGRCPACGRGGLFLGFGGYVTCSQRDCPNPGAAHEAIEQQADSNAAERSIRAAASHAEITSQPDKPRHPNGEPYSYAELEAGNWGFCDGCRMWSNGTIEHPHQCSATHIHGPFSKEQQ